MLDLHVHSTFSDGRCTPSEIVQMAADLGLTAISIADHDSVGWVAEAMAEGEKRGVTVISWVEISASYRNKALHVLGYGIDIANRALTEALDGICEYRRSRIEKMVGLLNAELLAEGLSPISVSEVMAIPVDGSIGRPHLAKFLFDRGYVRTEQEAFVRWLEKVNVPNKTLPVETAIRLVREAGGVAVLAHPGSLGISLRAITENVSEQIAILLEFRSQWLRGIEAYRPDQDLEYIRIARETGMLATGGSDFHGGGLTDILTLGHNDAPDTVADELFAEIGASRVSKLLSR